MVSVVLVLERLDKVLKLKEKIYIKIFNKGFSVFFFLILRFLDAFCGFVIKRS